MSSRTIRLSSRTIRPIAQLVSLGVLALALASGATVAAEKISLTPEVEKLISKYCFECHSTDVGEADVDYEAFENLDLDLQSKRLEQLIRVVKSGEMPPKDSPHLSPSEIKSLLNWSENQLNKVAESFAGDPGPVVLRRLNNVEYTFSIRDLTHLESVDPAKEFPGDNAAGEGFTNAGAAMVMSPALLDKYLGAAKEIAQHAVLLPRGVEFAESTSVNDQSNLRLDRIRKLYDRYSDGRGADKVNLQGVIFETNQGGKLPFDLYIRALQGARQQLNSKQITIEQLAAKESLSSKYLELIWNALSRKSNQPGEAGSRDLLLDQLRIMWLKEDANGDQISQWIADWQRALWKFNSVGHIGKQNGPKSWQEAVAPLQSHQTLRGKIAPNQKEFYLQISDAGDGTANDVVVWSNPRFALPGQPDISLTQAIAISSDWEQFQKSFAESATDALKIASTLNGPVDSSAIRRLAETHQMDSIVLEAWLSNVGLRVRPNSEQSHFDTLLTQKGVGLANLEFINGWVAEDALSLLANSSDQTVRVPGTMIPKSLAVHPAPTQSIGIGLTLPSLDDDAKSIGKVHGLVQHVHSECGNGTQWSLELWRGEVRIPIQSGFTAGGQVIAIPEVAGISFRSGDQICLIVSPRDNNHSCDLTRIDFSVEIEGTKWNATEALSQSILASNPQPDSKGGSWRIFKQPVSEASHGVIPQNSVLAKWLLSSDSNSKHEFANQLQNLMRSGTSDNPSDTALLQSLSSLPKMLGALPQQSKSGPLVLDVQSRDKSGAISMVRTPISDQRIVTENIDWIRIPIPMGLQNGWEFIVDATLDPERGKEGSVQLGISNSSTEIAKLLSPSMPVLIAEESQKKESFLRAMSNFRDLFPIALCYHKIVPVDEVVTLTLYHREDDAIKRLMLTANESEELDRLWEELHFVSQDALRSVDVFEQLWQYATQDADPSAFEPLRQPILNRAEQFRKEQFDAQQKHLDWTVGFATKAFRRKLSEKEVRAIHHLYETLRSQDLSHLHTIQAMIARILVSPDFLYRLERSSMPGSIATEKSPYKSVPISDYEFATRLSYFLWSSLPDQALLDAVSNGELTTSEDRAKHVDRMIQDPKSARFAKEFFGQWLQIANVDKLDEKSEQVFPEFVKMRGAMQAESNLFFQHLVKSDCAPEELLSARYTYVDQTLKDFYGINTPRSAKLGGNEFEFIENARDWHRGGLLSHASLMSKLAGASRTSAILRGTWISEVLLGEHLPKPPKNVPPLPETVPTNLSERQLIELHANHEACSACHKRIDPFGFALENYDAIGRFRTSDTSGHSIDSNAILPDGKRVQGIDELRSYLLINRKREFLMQFHRKLLGYAIGRECRLSDKPFLEKLTDRALEDPNYGIWDAIHAVVSSKPFCEIRGE